MFGRSTPERREEEPCRVHVNNPAASTILAGHLLRLLHRLCACDRPLAIVCIGTDRSTGDCLGPLIGSKLGPILGPETLILGTLDEPVHAVNLEEVLRDLYIRLTNPFVVAVDACLGQSESVGFITLKEGPLQPGTGVNKNLPAVGDLHLIGVVNVGGFMEYLVLQNTRLSLVMRMAEVIAAALWEGIGAFRTPAVTLPAVEPAVTRLSWKGAEG
ncbi:MAG: spore protease YyaC [Firmicutes bacterium]|nr:spore protease YyaC [Bacillota bacterium]